MRDGVKRRSERKFFPGYVLVQVEMTTRRGTWSRSVPRVLGFIGGSGGKPAPITEREADRSSTG